MQRVLRSCEGCSSSACAIDCLDSTAALDPGKEENAIYTDACFEHVLMVTGHARHARQNYSVQPSTCTQTKNLDLPLLRLVEQKPILMRTACPSSAAGIGRVGLYECVEV